MERIKVEKEKLIMELKENRKKHKSLVEKAKAGYIRTMKKELNRLMNEVEQNKVINLHDLYKFEQPVDKTEEYDTALEMLEMSIENEIVLTRREFQNFVQDKWDWTHQMLTSNTRYL